MQVEVPNDVGIVQRSPFDGSSGQKHRIKISNRRYGTSSANLKRNGLKNRADLFSFVFVSDCPARRFGRCAQVLLQTQRIDFNHNSVGCHG